MIGVVDDRVATPVCASNVCHARVLALSLSLSLFLSLYLPASRTPPYVCLCAKQGVEKGEWGRREEERVRCAGTRVSPLSDLTVGHATQPGRSYLAAMEGILCRIMDKR